MKRRQRSGGCHGEGASCCVRGRDGGGRRFIHRGETDWRAVIRDYRVRHRASHYAELKHHENCSTLAEAIAKASLARDQNDKRYPHQRRIPQGALNRASQKLGEAESDLGRCNSFEELHNRILEVLKGVPGVGELYCYDTALRISAYRGLRPRTVLLHAGTRVGAKALTATRGKHCLVARDLPRELRRLPPEQVEDILCIYKDVIRKKVGVH